MPKKETLRRYYPDSSLTDEELLELAVWVSEFLGIEWIKVNNKTYAALVAYIEKSKKEGMIEKSEPFEKS